MISIICGILLTIAVIIFLFFVYFYIGFCICSLLDHNGWFDRLDINDIDKQTIAVCIWPIIVVLLIVQLIVYCFLLVISFFTNAKKLFNEIKYGAWLAGSLICEICVKIFSKKK